MNIKIRYKPTYNSWRSMKGRCIQRSHKDWSIYGGEGIKVCDRWLGPKGFFNFLEDMGERPVSKTLDRVDGLKDYTPDNCRWATPFVQGNNTSRNISIMIEGITKNASEWGRINGVSPGTIYNRMQRGWTPEKAVTVKPDPKFVNRTQMGLV